LKGLNELKVLGIDPGSHATGYGVIEKVDRGLHCIIYGEVKPPKKARLSVCLTTIYAGIKEAIHNSNPEIMAIEDIFYGKNISSLIKQGHVRGVAVLAGAQEGLSIFEYTPLEVKKAVTGYGLAEKIQIQIMVKKILRLKEMPSPDAADALAVAICHMNFLKIEQV
jgi:crossover junction endodeoxyribonuclease RuvC